jgi:hypothetical protein
LVLSGCVSPDGIQLIMNVDVSYPVTNASFKVNGIEISPGFTHNSCYDKESLFEPIYNGNASSFE